MHGETERKGCQTRKGGYSFERMQTSPGRIQAYLLASRPKTLVAAIVPVSIGGALAWGGGVFSLAPWLICLGFGLLIQVGTNFANDVQDYEKGTDTADRIGPARAVAAGWIRPGEMWLATGLVFGAALLVGLMLVAYGGWWLVLLGLISVGCGYAYTGGPYPLGYNGLGDIFVFVFFGWVATVFTYMVQAGGFTIDLAGASWLSWGGPWLVGMVPGALSTNLLVVNNYRDAEGDALSGKRTLVVRFGRRFGWWEFATP